MHPRVGVSAISTYRWGLEEDLAFYAGAGITNVGVSAGKLEQAGWDRGVALVRDAGLRVTNLIGLGPFRLDEPTSWTASRERLDRALDAARQLAAECLVITTGPAGRLTWEAAADAVAEALAPTVQGALAAGLPVALEHTNPLRVDVGFVHTLRDALDLARRLGTGVCMEVNACWAERGLSTTVRAGCDTLLLVQVSDFAVGTHCTPDRLVPGDGDIDLERVLGEVLDSGYRGVFDIELIGPRIDAEGYPSAVGRAIEWLTRFLEERPAP